MGVVRAQIQTVEEIYRLVWTAVANKQPIEATYQSGFDSFCPHRLGRNREGRLRVFCDQYGGESRSGLQSAGSLSNWRCVALEKLSRVKVSGRSLAHSAKSFASYVLVLWTPMAMPIIPSVIHKKDIEEVAQVVAGQG